MGNENPASWYALCFSDTGPEGHVNAYPNINFNIRPEGIELSVNAEIVKSRELLLRRMREQPEQFEANLQRLPDMRLALYSKLQYQAMDNFVWKLLPGYPVAAVDVRTRDILGDLKQMTEIPAHHPLRNGKLFRPARKRTELH